MGFVVDKAAFGAGFFQVLRFPLPRIALTAPHSSFIIIPGCTIGHKWPQFHSPKKKKKKERLSFS
jgi:hypothetical protein